VFNIALDLIIAVMLLFQLSVPRTEALSARRNIAMIEKVGDTIINPKHRAACKILIRRNTR